MDIGPGPSATHTHPSCSHDEKPTLTRNERLVLAVLSAAGEAVKAYDVLAALREHGVKAPMTVYRALDRLEHKGLVHKIDALNAYVACSHQAAHKVQSFLVCGNCNKVTELEERGVSALQWSAMQAIAAPSSFSADDARIEIRGICQECKAG